MPNSKAKDSALAEELKSSKSTKKQSQKTGRKQKKKPVQQSSDDSITGDEASFEGEKNASHKIITKDGEVWRAIRHPRLTTTNSPRYFVNKNAVVCYKVAGVLRPLNRRKKGASYDLTSEPKKSVTIKLDEIMAYTFSGQQFDSGKPYILHKDGDPKNCAWDNLEVYDLPSLQEMEIARLQKEHPNTSYTVVRNVHHTLTFERYLVSDTGDIYSLASQRHLRTSLNKKGEPVIGLYADSDARQTTVSRSTTLRAHLIVMQSFKGRHQENLQVIHLNRDLRDFSLKNLAYASPQDVRRLQTSEKPPVEGQRKTLRKVESVSLPPVTKKTRWRTIGVLPWNGESYSHYEVSDMGHVRQKSTSRLLQQSCSDDGYPCVSLDPDEKDSTGGSKRLRVSRLVANAFVNGYSETTNVVLHLNRNQLDSSAQNLKWMAKEDPLIQKRACPVMAVLVGDSTSRKDFPSMTKARGELHINFQGSTAQREATHVRMVNWDGEKKMAMVHVFSRMKTKKSK